MLGFCFELFTILVGTWSYALIRDCNHNKSVYLLTSALHYYFYDFWADASVQKPAGSGTGNCLY